MWNRPATLGARMPVGWHALVGDGSRSSRRVRVEGGPEPAAGGGRKQAARRDDGSAEARARQGPGRPHPHRAGPRGTGPSAGAPGPGAVAANADAGHPGPPAGAVAGAYFQEVPIGAVVPNPRQPRKVFDEEALDELVESIREVGLLQPVVVREVEPGRFELVMGERRWRASQRAGLTEIPAIVRATADDDLLRDALMENLHREQLNPLEEAAAYQQLLDDFGATHDELARKVGRSRPHISNTLRLLNLPGPVQRRVAAGVLPPAMPVPCWPSTMRTRRITWPTASWRKACRFGRSRRSSRWAMSGRSRPAAPIDPAGVRARAGPAGGPAGGCVRHQGQGRAGPAQGKDRRGVRLDRGPGADRRHHVTRMGRDTQRVTPARRLPPGRLAESSR